MTKKERVLQAFKNQPVDRIPMGFWYHFSPDEDHGQETVEQHLKLYRDADMDMIKVCLLYTSPLPASADRQLPARSQLWTGGRV